MPENDPRLEAIEARLARIEAALGLHDAEEGAASASATTSATATSADDGRAARREPARRPRPSGPRLDPTQLMAWGASFAFILAAGYFVKLVYDAGWLTPERQIGLAGLCGIALIGGGLAFARVDRSYAAYLPAVGTVVLYLAVFSGHVFYDFFGLMTALAAVAAITLTAIWLGRRLGNSAYSLLAATGTYLTPLLIDAARADIIDLVVYFSAWGLLFSFVALQEGRRTTYLAALYFALFGFDIAFRMTDESAWALAAGYQLLQFAVFSATSVAFTIRHERPMTSGEAATHGLALFYFYAIEFLVLKEHAPALAPWLALASVAAVVVLYLFARSRMDDAGRLEAGALLTSTYASVVTAHIVYVELMPDGWHAWAGLLVPLAFGFVLRTTPRPSRALLPAAAVSGIVFVVSFLRAIFGPEGGDDVPMPALLLMLYAAALYGIYGVFRSRPEGFRAAPLSLYAGHGALLTASVRFLDSAMAISVAWAVLAILLLLYSIKRLDRTVGQSSLVIFTASSLKVLIHDLSDSTPIVRVVTLVVLAASLYAGGWLYQKIGGNDDAYHPDPRVNEQLNLIRRLAGPDRSDEDVAAELVRRGVECLDPGKEWTADLVARIRQEFGFR
ncbi:MAG: DUF2339 domain-containing protein [bacterium]|nr:DUF2339 domain-containing protein [bacterium]